MMKTIKFIRGLDVAEMQVRDDQKEFEYVEVKGIKSRYASNPLLSSRGEIDVDETTCIVPIIELREFYRQYTSDNDITGELCEKVDYIAISKEAHDLLGRPMKVLTEELQTQKAINERLTKHSISMSEALKESHMDNVKLSTFLRESNFWQRLKYLFIGAKTFDQ